MIFRTDKTLLAAVVDLKLEVSKGQALAEQARADHWDLLKHYRRLIDQLLSMKKDGFVLPPEAPVPVEPLPLLPADIQAALEVVQEPGLEELVRGWLAAGHAQADVVARIYRGGESVRIVS